MLYDLFEWFFSISLKFFLHCQHNFDFLFLILFAGYDQTRIFSYVDHWIKLISERRFPRIFCNIFSQPLHTRTVKKKPPQQVCALIHISHHLKGQSFVNGIIVSEATCFKGLIWLMQQLKGTTWNFAFRLPEAERKARYYR